jgi:hypothetical protein
MSGINNKKKFAKVGSNKFYKSLIVDPLHSHIKSQIIDFNLTKNYYNGQLHNHKKRAELFKVIQDGMPEHVFKAHEKYLNQEWRCLSKYYKSDQKTRRIFHDRITGIKSNL